MAGNFKEQLLEQLAAENKQLRDAAEASRIKEEEVRKQRLEYATSQVPNYVTEIKKECLVKVRDRQLSISYTDGSDMYLVSDKLQKALEAEGLTVYCSNEWCEASRDIDYPKDAYSYRLFKIRW